MAPPFSRRRADAAADWLTLLMSEEASEADRQRWRQWRAAHPENDLAWRHIESIVGQLRQLPAEAAMQAMRAPASRRKALRLLAGAGMAGTAVLLARHGDLWQGLAADYRSATGQQRRLELPDGTRLLLNTATAVDVHFTAAGRAVMLRYGEVAIETGHADGRPFVLRTADGEVRPLGTRFTVRAGPAGTAVAVQEGAVALEPRQGPSLALNAGQVALLRAWGAERPRAANAQDDAWTRGQLMAADTRLADFLADLGRYRAGWLRCHPAVADLRFSGVYPLADTERVLRALEQALPIRLLRRTRYWVSAEPLD